MIIDAREFMDERAVIVDWLRSKALERRQMSETAIETIAPSLCASSLDLDVLAEAIENGEHYS